MIPRCWPMKIRSESAQRPLPGALHTSNTQLIFRIRISHLRPDGRAPPPDMRPEEETLGLVIAPESRSRNVTMPPVSSDVAFTSCTYCHAIGSSMFDVRDPQYAPPVEVNYPFTVGGLSTRTSILSAHLSLSPRTGGLLDMCTAPCSYSRTRDDADRQSAST